MKNDTDIIALRQPESVDDPLTEIARDGARRMLAAALRAEADTFVAQYAEEAPPDGRQRVVRHGHAPERSIQTGTWEIPRNQGGTAVKWRFSTEDARMKLKHLLSADKLNRRTRRFAGRLFD